MQMMDQSSRFHVFDFCRSDLLRESLVGILKTSFGGGRAEIQVDVVTELVQSQQVLLEKVTTSAPVVLFLIANKQQSETLAKAIEVIKRKKQNAEIIVIPQACDSAEIIHLIQSGASDFITPPLTASGTVPRLYRLLESAKRHGDPTRLLKAKVGMKSLVGKAPCFVEEIKKTQLVAGCDSRVLILGETGTGKELFARAIHYLSLRTTHPFVPVSCGAIPVELIENELFGHSEGAYTGATASKMGLIREAEGGTLFLDEIDSIPLLAQAKLLRFLQEGEYRPLGAAKSRQADVRVIAASNMDLAQAVKDGKLRRDLYYRLNIIRLNLPPLRERREDIPLLAEHFREKYAHEFHKNVRCFSDAALRKLMLYEWPGNVRELENNIERAIILAESESIRESDISLSDVDVQTDRESFQESKAKTIAQFERTYIQCLMSEYHGNVSQAARAVQKNRRALWELIRKHEINVQSFRFGSQSH